MKMGLNLTGILRSCSSIFQLYQKMKIQILSQLRNFARVGFFCEKTSPSSSRDFLGIIGEYGFLTNDFL